MAVKIWVQDLQLPTCICNQCILPQKFLTLIKDCQRLTEGLTLGTPVSFSNKTDGICWQWHKIHIITSTFHRVILWWLFLFVAEKSAHLPHVTDKLLSPKSVAIAYCHGRRKSNLQLHWQKSSYCIGRCKSNYHMIVVHGHLHIL
jgi:hypothetical protein